MDSRLRGNDEISIFAFPMPRFYCPLPLAPHALLDLSMDYSSQPHPRQCHFRSMPTRTTALLVCTSIAQFLTI